MSGFITSQGGGTDKISGYELIFIIIGGLGSKVYGTNMSIQVYV